jgi:mRNA interferase MazF
VVLVSREEAYRVRDLVTVVPVTTRIRELPTEVVLGRAEGLPRRCVANADDIVTIPKQTLREYAGTLSVDAMARLETAIRFALGLD